MVPLATKRPIVTRVLAATEATEDIPVTIIRNHEGILFLDQHSFPSG